MLLVMAGSLGSSGSHEPRSSCGTIASSFAAACATVRRGSGVGLGCGVGVGAALATSGVTGELVGPTRPQGGSTERLAALLDATDLSPFQKDVLRQGWLDQVGWMSRQSRRAHSWFLIFRIPVVIGSVLIPGLVSVSLTTSETGNLPWLRLVTFGVSLLVAVLAALEEVFHFGDRWRHYRRTAERLKSAGWHFLMLNGPYRRVASHAEAFPAFAGDIEEILNEDVEGYLTEVAGEGPDRERHEIVH